MPSHSELDCTVVFSFPSFGFSGFGFPLVFVFVVEGHTFVASYYVMAVFVPFGIQGTMRIVSALDNFMACLTIFETEAGSVDLTGAVDRNVT